MCELRSLIHRLVISKSVEGVSSLKQDGSMAGYINAVGTRQFLLKCTVRHVGMVRVCYVGAVRFRI